MSTFNQINGGVGNDNLTGTPGPDYILGGDGNDTIFSDGGSDALDGGAGNDQLFGESANDLLVGNTGNDTLFAGDGNDSLFGNDGNDILFGEGGADTLIGGAGNDVLVGGFGPDTYLPLSDGSVDRIVGFGSEDVIRFTTANFRGVSTGDGTNIGQNVVQVANSVTAAGGAITTLFVGLDTVPGADVALQIVGTLGPNQFIANGTDISVRSYDYYTLSDGRMLERFNTTNLGTPSSIVEIKGIGGASVVGIDYRAANNVMYALTTDNRIYAVDPTTGNTVLSSVLAQPLNLANPFAAVDFNPVADRLRVVDTNGQDYRIEVDTGRVTVDGAIAYGAGDANTGRTAAITGVAYTNSRAGATATTLYDDDAQNRVLAVQNPPNNGTLATVGGTGIGPAVINGFDIVTNAQGENIGLAVQSSINGNILYRVDLNTGVHDVIGLMGNAPDFIRDIAIIPV